MIYPNKISLTTTEQALVGGLDNIQGIGQDYLFSVTSSFNVGDQLTMTFVDTTTGFQTQIGAGFVSGVQPVYAFTFSNKVYTLAGSSVYFSAVGRPAIWNDPNAAGNGYLQLGDYFGTTLPLLAAAPYQGKLAFFARQAVMIYTVNADPTQWQLGQILENTGTVAPLSVQAIGDLEVMYLSDTGIRSLRARETTLNAYVNDLGSAIDSLVTASNGSNSTACGVVDPATGRYWCYVNGLIYVLSYFPASKILAWSTYLPTYQTAMTPAVKVYTVTAGRKYYWAKGSTETSITDGITTLTASGYITVASTSLTITGTVDGAVYEMTPFTPQKFVVYNGKVYCRDANRFYLYGGAAGTTYDYSQGIAATTWLDCAEPANDLKKGQCFDTAFVGNMAFSVGMDNLSGVLQQVYAGTQVTFQKGEIPCSVDGYHVKMQAVTLDNNAATLSSMLFEYVNGNAKK
jgi:hypothetical protein